MAVGCMLLLAAAFPTLLNERLYTASQCFMQQLYSAREFRAIRAFLLFAQAAFLYKISEIGNVLRQEHRVVQQLFVALITEDSGFTLMPPGARLKQALGNCSPAVRGAPEKPLRDQMVLRGMTSAFGSRAGVSARRPMQDAVTDGTAFGHFIHSS